LTDFSDPADVRRAANEHWKIVYEGLIASLGGEWRDLGAVQAFVTREVPAHFANGLLVLERAERTHVVDAIRWVQEAGVPFSVRVDALLARDVLDAPLALGLERREWLFPGMVLQPIPRGPRPATGVTASLVDRANHDDFVTALVGQGMAREFAMGAFGPQLLNVPGVSLFVAYLDDQPVGNSILVETGDTSGIYSVGVVESARRRGVGLAVTWAAVDHAREIGSLAVFLQSTQVGFGVYSAMGFRTVAEYAWFGPPQPEGEEARE
jgi:GNAT superfamily N-acetyltransferase